MTFQFKACRESGRRLPFARKDKIQNSSFRRDLPPETILQSNVEFAQPFEGANRCERAVLQRRKLFTARQGIA